MSKIEVDTIDTVTGTTTLQVGSTNVSTINLGASGDTINIPSGATFNVNGTVGTMSGHNYPAFEAYRSSNVTVTNNTVTKVPINAEVFDTNGYYDNATNYRFTPLVAGKYYFYASVYGFGNTANNLSSAQVFLYKNGSNYKGAFYANSSSSGAYTKTPYIHAIIDMNGTTDYLETYTLLETISGSNPVILSNVTNKQASFGGFRIGA